MVFKTYDLELKYFISRFSLSSTSYWEFYSRWKALLQLKLTITSHFQLNKEI